MSSLCKFIGNATAANTTILPQFKRIPQFCNTDPRISSSLSSKHHHSHYSTTTATATLLNQKNVGNQQQTKQAKRRHNNNNNNASLNLFFAHLNKATASNEQQQRTSASSPSSSAHHDDHGRIRRITPYGFWRDPHNHARFLEWAATQLGVKQLDDWYDVTVEDMVKLGGSTLLKRYYGNSLQRALSSAYPEHEWLPWRFRNAQHRFWRDPANHRRFFDWAAKKLNVHRKMMIHEVDGATVVDLHDGWYQFGYDDLKKLPGGESLLHGYYNGSLIRALAAVYPEHEWLPWRFKQVPRSFWRDTTTHRAFFDWAAKALGVRQHDDWYAVVAEDVNRIGGDGLLQLYYNGSLIRALAAVYPDREWLPWRFKQVPQSFWSDVANQRWFLDWVAKELGIVAPTASTTTITTDNNDNSTSSTSNNNNNNNSNSNSNSFVEGWYLVSKEDVCALGGDRMLNSYYGSSLIRALAAVYPEHQWDPWRFQRCVLGKDDRVDDAALRRFVEGTLAPQFHVEKLEDWYRVSVSRARRTVDGYKTVVERHGGLAAVLRRLYPHHEWDDRMLKSKDKRASQRTLRLATQRLLPGEEVLEDYAHPGLRFHGSDTTMTLDIWVPSLSLALEFQGEQHYRDIYGIGGSPADQRQRDEEKADACARAGITLVVVPYWWRDECSVDDLAATILAEVGPAFRSKISASPHLQGLVAAAQRGTPISGSNNGSS